MDLDLYDIQRRNDGVLLVRVRSPEKNGRRLPDAVFTFRRGDPQYEYWDKVSRQRSTAGTID